MKKILNIEPPKDFGQGELDRFLDELCYESEKSTKLVGWCMVGAGAMFLAGAIWYFM